MVVAIIVNVFSSYQTQLQVNLKEMRRTIVEIKGNDNYEQYELYK